MDGNKLWLNSRLIQSLDTSLDEDQILSSINRLTVQKKQIESVSGASLRTIKLRNEIEKLEEKLTYCREQTSLRRRRDGEKT